MLDNEVTLGAQRRGRLNLLDLAQLVLINCTEPDRALERDVLDVLVLGPVGGLDGVAAELDRLVVARAEVALADRARVRPVVPSAEARLAEEVAAGCEHACGPRWSARAGSGEGGGAPEVYSDEQMTCDDRVSGSFTWQGRGSGRTQAASSCVCAPSSARLSRYRRWLLFFVIESLSRSVRAQVSVLIS